MEYEKLLEEAYKKVKKTNSSGERFKTPKIEGHFEGKKTILTNFFQIASDLRRNPDHFQKFMLKELAASGQKEGDRLILNRKILRDNLDKKVSEYTKEFVLCKECKKPDTELVKEGKVNILRCLACGAKHPVKGV
ncbi:MAG: translation initiation factor IF-2 subunit beta [Candidatus Pacearchaeota archaeon]